MIPRSASLLLGLVGPSSAVADGVLAVGGQTMLAGTTAEIVVEGGVDADAVFGVTIILQLVPEPGAIGTLEFTPAEDIEPLENPWGDSVSFQPFDVDQTESALLNGAVISNVEITPTTFDGPLAAFPVVASADARGIWRVQLCLSPCTAADSSSWEGVGPVATATVDGSIRVAWLPLRDFAIFQNCFGDPSPHCAQHDDLDDYAGWFDGN